MQDFMQYRMVCQFAIDIVIRRGTLSPVPKKNTRGFVGIVTHVDILLQNTYKISY